MLVCLLVTILPRRTRKIRQSLRRLQGLIYRLIWKAIKFARGLTITERVSFNVASEASYVYILSGQMLIKNAKNGPFWRVFENLKLVVKQCYQTSQF